MVSLASLSSGAFLFLTFILKYKHEKNFYLFFYFVVGGGRCGAGFFEFGSVGGGKFGFFIFHREVASANRGGKNLASD
jgi:hypothetical protein